MGYLNIAHIHIYIYIYDMYFIYYDYRSYLFLHH